MSLANNVVCQVQNMLRKKKVYQLCSSLHENKEGIVNKIKTNHHLVRMYETTHSARKMDYSET